MVVYCAGAVLCRACFRPLTYAAVLFLLGVFSTYPTAAFAACSSPSGVAGDLIWSSAENVPAYCNDADWVGFPKSGGVTVSWTTPANGPPLNTPSPNANDNFGTSVSVSDNLAVVGAAFDESDGGAGVGDAGRAYVYDTTTGVLIATLNNPSPHASDNFGYSVSISGNLALVGAYQDESDGGTGVSGAGRAYVYDATTGALITALNNPSPHTNDYFGYSVSISGNLALVGAFQDESDGGTGVGGAGRAYVFDATTGALITALNNPSPHTSDFFGASVSLSGNLALVGALTDESDGVSGMTNAGRAYVFNATTGTLITALNNPSPNMNDYFGASVSISGNVALVGAYQDESDGVVGVSDAGRAYVFNATTGTLITALNNPSPNGTDHFGYAVSISGDLALVGARWDESDGGTGVSSAGRAYMYDATTGALIVALNNPSPHANDWFGYSVSLSGNTAVVGAYQDESDGGAGVANAGRAYILEAGGGAGCVTPTGVVGDILYNATFHVLQYCDGSGWHAVGPLGDGGGGCSNPAGIAGDVIYNSAHNYLQYCEGDAWIGVGR